MNIIPTMNTHIRKQVYELTPSDLRDSPIWEFCTDEENVGGQDEATVRPVSINPQGGFGPGACIVACNAIFADGSQVSGYVYAGNARDLGCVQPVIVLPDGQVNTWAGWLRFVDTKAFAAQAYSLLERSGASIFPIHFIPSVRVEGCDSVELRGFAGLDLNRQPVTFQ